MGDHTVSFVCRDPRLTPSPVDQEAAREIVRRALQKYDEITTPDRGKVQFFMNCDGGWDTYCPRCKRQMLMDDVVAWLDEDYDLDTGFRLVPRAMPCCDATLILNELTFDPPAAFAKFAIEVRNPNWFHADEVPSAREAGTMSEAHRRTGATDARWGEIRRKWAGEIDAETERLAVRVGEALGAPVRVVWCHL